MYDRFSGIKFLSSDRNTENMITLFYYNEDIGYSKENTCENEVFSSTIERS